VRPAFEDRSGYAAYRLPDRQIDAFLDAVHDLAKVPDARSLIDCLIAPAACH
jgi:hypothetical protein